MEQVPDVVRIEMVVFQIMDLGRAWLFGQPLGHPATPHLAGSGTNDSSKSPEKKITSITR